MYIDYERYIISIRDNLIQCGINLSKEVSLDLGDYKNLFSLSIKLNEILEFYRVLAVSGSEYMLENFFLPLSDTYKDRMRSICYAEYMSNILPDYKKLLGAEGVDVDSDEDISIKGTSYNEINLQGSKSVEEDENLSDFDDLFGDSRSNVLDDFDNSSMGTDEDSDPLAMFANRFKSVDDVVDYEGGSDEESYEDTDEDLFGSVPYDSEEYDEESYEESEEDSDGDLFGNTPYDSEDDEYDDFVFEDEETVDNGYSEDSDEYLFGSGYSDDDEEEYSEDTDEDLFGGTPYDSEEEAEDDYSDSDYSDFEDDEESLFGSDYSEDYEEEYSESDYDEGDDEESLFGSDYSDDEEYSESDYSDDDEEDYSESDYSDDEEDDYLESDYGDDDEDEYSESVYDEEDDYLESDYSDDEEDEYSESVYDEEDDYLESDYSDDEEDAYPQVSNSSSNTTPKPVTDVKTSKGETDFGDVIQDTTNKVLTGIKKGMIEFLNKNKGS